jgi:hypothetical protein
MNDQNHVKTVLQVFELQSESLLGTFFPYTSKAFPTLTERFKNIYTVLACFPCYIC